jgi:methylated-DNA-[protein]-cysteine S-methyltransferase
MDQSRTEGEEVTYYTTIRSPIGKLTLSSDGTGLTGLHMEPYEPFDDWKRDRGPFADVTDQLGAYFAGDRTSFDLPLAPSGTPFQMKVWSALRTIPYGKVRSYGDIARRIKNPKAVRAVGSANRSNPIAIIVPCHRVIGANGTLTGFGGGLDRKAKLLALEGLTFDRGSRSSSKVR